MPLLQNISNKCKIKCNSPGKGQYFQGAHSISFSHMTLEYIWQYLIASPSNVLIDINLNGIRTTVLKITIIFSCFFTKWTIKINTVYSTLPCVCKRLHRVKGIHWDNFKVILYSIQSTLLIYGIHYGNLNKNCTI